MADDPGTTPAPRPRRRRKDFDPSFTEPPVANERRRRKASTPAPKAGSPATVEAPAGAVVDPAADAVQAAIDSAPIVDPAPVDASPVDLSPVDPAAAPTTLFAVPIAAATPPTGPREAWLPLLDDRSPDPAVCPFLRAADGDTLGMPVAAPVLPTDARPCMRPFRSPFASRSSSA